jgi:hypothetical protein
MLEFWSGSVDIFDRPRLRQLVTLRTWFFPQELHSCTYLSIAIRFK